MATDDVAREGATTMQIDTSSEFGARAARRLKEEAIGWLTTSGPNGEPQPSPIWFLWDGETALIYSQPNTPKLRHIAANPRVSLNLDGDGHGGNIIILTGEARIEESIPPVTEMPAYIAKYAEGIQRIGMTPESFARAYSVPIRFTPRRIRGH
jgi:PPOX class probable F420-dependent enzyme